MSRIPEREDSLKFPRFTVLKASAGSGKTYALTRRIVQFLLSESIPKNKLKNILAVTFSNNAAKEMKERTLSWLKEIYFGNPEKITALSEKGSIAPEILQARAAKIIDDILQNFSDFQIKTIDSFMTTVFKASAIDFGYNFDFEILMDNRSLMTYAFDLFLKNVREGTPEAAALEEIVDSFHHLQKEPAAFLWVPSKHLLEESRKVFGKISSQGKEVAIEDFSADLTRLRAEITLCVERIETEIERSGLIRHRQSVYPKVLDQVRGKRFQDLGGRSYSSPPVTKPAKGNGGKSQEAYDSILEMWNQFRKLSNQLTVIYCRSKCNPYIKTFQSFTRYLERAKKLQGKIFIEDINHDLSKYLTHLIVPDIYFRLGEKIYHFLIDEFQDTSPVQWQNLFPLIENSLSQGGTLFLVGDTKQSIYGFRNADYTIMKELEQFNPFPSAQHEVKELEVNYRSNKKIVDFNARVFKDHLQTNSDYFLAGQRSGLTDYVQRAEDDKEEDGYVEVTLLENHDNLSIEREIIQNRINDLRMRGYNYRDIAILTQANEHAVRVTSWLNEKGIPFISYSSLDIRRRRIVRELIALISFLDSPPDHFSFATFLLGEIFSAKLRKDFPKMTLDQLRTFCFEQKASSQLYKAFQLNYQHLWERYFETPFKVSGFLPLYDLVSEIYDIFSLFENHPGEEAALVKFLEVVHEFEERGTNNLSDFLVTVDENEGGNDDWELSVPKNVEAVNVMTIHKAKGLGFPAVILLLYEVRNRGHDFILEEAGENVHLLRINKGEAECDETLNSLYEKESMKEWVNRLNTLYVGLTRPERELHIIGLVRKKENYPFFLFSREKDGPARKPVYRSGSDRNPQPAESRAVEHRSRKRQLSMSHEESSYSRERLRGEFIHRILFAIQSFDNETGEQVRNAVTGIEEEWLISDSKTEISLLVEKLLSHLEIRPLYRSHPGREIMNEREFVDSSGRLFRMDRVVVDPEEVTVMEFKTGKEKSGYRSDRAQLEYYTHILREVYPDKRIKGLLIYVDRNEVEKIL